MEHVKWARVDYLTEAQLCTRWLISRYEEILDPTESVCFEWELKRSRLVHPSCSLQATKVDNSDSFHRARSDRTARLYSNCSSPVIGPTPPFGRVNTHPVEVGVSLLSRTNPMRMALVNTDTDLGWTESGWWSFTSTC